MTHTAWYYRLPVKIAAFFVAGLFALAGLFMVLAAAVSIFLAGSMGTTDEAERQVAGYFLSLYDWEVARNYAENGLIPAADVPYTYQITEGDAVLASTYDGGLYTAYSQDTYYFPYWLDGKEMAQRTVTATLYAKPAAQLTGDSWLELAVQWIGHWHRHRWSFGVGGALCGLLTLTVLIYLYCAAGHRYGQVAPQCNAVDRIPFDLVTLLYGAAASGLLWLLRELFTADVVPFLMGMLLVAVAAVALGLSYTMSLATRIKTRTLLRNTVVAIVGRSLLRGGRAVSRRVDALWQVLAGFSLLSLLEIAILYVWRWAPHRQLVLPWAAKTLLAGAVLLWVCLGLCRLREGIRRQAAGDNTRPIDTSGLPGALVPVAEDLNHIGDGMAAQVEARLKSERFKTELITNVSHDIKTPLTSIINYVDLLEKENSENPKIQEYLAVLQRQSTRLKKLIEDLMEASKASTGNLSVQIQPCRLDVLLEQMAGEYAEKLAAGNLQLLIDRPDGPVIAAADGRHLWRVLDNLLNNVCKYAQPDTRVYVDLTAHNGQARLTLRNISRSPLNVSGEELLERFVRGDSARHTEGSGLGLSIARSLMELQGGSLSLTVDGDLFKVCLTLPTAQE